MLNDTDRYMSRDMSRGYITSLYIAIVRVMVEHNQAELRDLTVSTHSPFEIVRDRRLS